MSLKKYLESKIRPRILVVIDEYKEKLNADIAALLLKPNSLIEVEVKKHFVDMQHINKILSSLNYPLKDEFSIAIKSGDPKQVSKAYAGFKRYAEYAKLSSSLMEEIETTIFSYQSRLFNSDLSINESENTVKSILSESQFILEKMAQSIDAAISTIPKWNNHKVTIVAQPSESLIVQEAKVIIGEGFFFEFTYEYTTKGFVIKNINENANPTLLENAQELLAKLQQNPKYNRILTLFMTRPISERTYLELVKRDLSLGITAVLPNHISFSTHPSTEENMDVWKIKIDSQHIFETLNEGIVQYKIIDSDAPIRWIERMSNEE